MISLVSLAAAMALIVQPNNGKMYVVENLSPDICIEASIIAETHMTVADFNAKKEAFYKQHSTATSYSWETFSRTYCVPQQSINISADGNNSSNGVNQPSSNSPEPTQQPKQQAPEGCGTVLACGGYKDQ